MNVSTIKISVSRTMCIMKQQETIKAFFLKGAIKANYGKGAALKADADRDGQDLVYVDQVGTFLNLGRNLETVMSPRWGETNSGVRLVRYPVYPESAGIDFQNIDEVEFRLSEVVYTLAECKMRAGDTEGAKELVYRVKTRYFTDKSALEQPGPGFTSFDMDWMLSEWGLEFLGEGRRRRTDCVVSISLRKGMVVLWPCHGRRFKLSG